MVSCGLVWGNDCAADTSQMYLKEGVPSRFELRHAQSRQQGPCRILPCDLGLAKSVSFQGFRWCLGKEIPRM